MEAIPLAPTEGQSHSSDPASLGARNGTSADRSRVTFSRQREFAMNPRRPGWRKWLVAAVKLLIVAPVVWAIHGTIARGLAQFRKHPWSLDWGWLTLAALLYLVGLLPGGAVLAPGLAGDRARGAAWANFAGLLHRTPRKVRPRQGHGRGPAHRLDLRSRRQCRHRRGERLSRNADDDGRRGHSWGRQSSSFTPREAGCCSGPRSA